MDKAGWKFQTTCVKAVDPKIIWQSNVLIFQVWNVTSMYHDSRTIVLLRNYGLCNKNNGPKALTFVNQTSSTMERRPTSEVSGRSASPKNDMNLQGPKGSSWCLHEPAVRNDELNESTEISCYHFRNHFNIISSVAGFPNSGLLRFRLNFCTHISSLLLLATYFAHLFKVIAPKIFGAEYKLWSSYMCYHL
jgi:hypothetical protein